MNFSAGEQCELGDGLGKRSLPLSYSSAVRIAQKKWKRKTEPVLPLTTARSAHWDRTREGGGQPCPHAYQHVVLTDAFLNTENGACWDN